MMLGQIYSQVHLGPIKGDLDTQTLPTRKKNAPGIVDGSWGTSVAVFGLL